MTPSRKDAEPQISYERSLTNQILLEGGGVTAGDFDGDGLVDLHFCHVDGSNALFRNLGGFKFQNVTMETGVGCTHQTSRGAAFADLNGEGALDLMVTSRGGPNACFQNDGQGHFQDITREAGGTYAEIANYAGRDASDWTWGAGVPDTSGPGLSGGKPAATTRKSF